MHDFLHLDAICGRALALAASNRLLLIRIAALSEKTVVIPLRGSIRE